MNVSEVKVRLSKDDLLDLVREIINLKGLIINEVILDKKIGMKGTYKKLFNIKFNISFNIIEVRERTLVIRLSELKVLGIPAIKAVRKLILKKILADFKNLGIDFEKDRVFVNLNELIKDFKFLSLGTLNIVHDKDSLSVSLFNSKVSINQLINSKKVDKLEKEPDIVLENVQEVLEEESIDKKEKVKDYYSDGRDFVEKKIPKKLKSVEDYILLVPDIFALIVRLIKDERINKQTKITVAASIAYVAMPKDLILDKIPITGSIDDMAVVLFALNKLINDVPLNIILENWAGDERNIVILKNALEYIKKFTKANNLDKFYSLVEALT